MPVVVITAPPLPDAGTLPAALSAVAVAVAGPLRLRAEDVVVTAVSTAATVVGTARCAGWPVVMLHGSPRDPEAMRTAQQAARHAVGRAWSVPEERIWSQWLVREPDGP